MSHQRIVTVLLFLQLLVWSATAIAQDSTSAAIEGQVFNSKTRQPLANVSVVYFSTDNDGSGGGVEMATDQNGFYELEVPSTILSGDVVTFRAVCHTRRGDVQMYGLLYQPLRPEIYRRDFYITLPSGVSRCSGIL